MNRFSSIFSLLVLSFFILGIFQVSHASHIMGGGLGYEYMGETTPGSNIYRYKIILKTYINCDPNSFVAFCEDPIEIAIYSHDQANPNADKTIVQILDIFNMTSDTITPELPDSCTVGKDACILECTYEGTVDLPLDFNGYNVLYHRCCRNCAILNLDINNCPSGDIGQTWYAYIPPTLTDNSSPVFTDSPVPYICSGDTTNILNTATDPDGDKLIFSFVTPYHGDGGAYPGTYAWPIPDSPYETNFDKDSPFGPAGYAYINASSGYSEYYPPDTGNFVIAVEVKEFRNNNLVGVTRRDLQLLIIQCPPNPPPNLYGAVGVGEIDSTIEEGDTICFPITFSDQDGDSLELILMGEVFESAQVNPVAIANLDVNGDSVVSSNFCWYTVCDLERALKYKFYAKVSDNGCPSKTENVEYRIKINEFEGADNISGKDTVCEFEQGNSYSAATFPGATYGWTITGGTKISGDSTNTIVIDWGSSGTGNVRLTTVSRRGCPGNTIDLSVQIDTLPVAKAGADISFCSSDSIQLGSSDVPTYSYTWSPTQGLSSSTIANPKISLINTSAITDTTLYILSIIDDLTSCIDADTVQVVVRPYPIPNAGADQSFCEKDTIELGTDSIAGYIYVWNPSTGLDDTSSSKPKLTLTNADSIPDTNFYDVTVSVFNCTAYDTTRIITRPLPISDAGSDLVFCSSDGDTLGVKSILNYTYLWSPEAGLDDKTSSKPIVSLTNSTNSRDTFIYKVTTTLDGCVTSDSSQVIVKHLPNPDAGSDLRICPDEQDTIGRDTIAPYLYSWSPSYGLNNTTLDNPLVVISVPDTTVTYIVTTTDTTTGCVDYDTVNVVIKPLPVSNAGPDTTFCSGDTISIGADTTVGYSYVWSPSTGLGDTAISRPLITLINSDTIPDTVFYIVTSTLEGCSTTDTVQVEIRNLPIANAGSDVGFCTGDSINMGVSAKVGYTYLWTPAEGLSDSSISNPQITLTTPSFPPDTIPYILINTLRGCNSSDTANVVVFPTPNTKEIIGSVSLCPGVTSVKYWVERPPNSTYQWFLQGNGSIVSGPPKDTIITDWTTAGAGKISIIETDSNNCVGDTFHLNLVVNAELEPPLPTGPDTLCDRYIDSVKYNVVFTNGSIYQWFVVGGQFLTGDTTNRVFVKWDGVGSGVIWYEEESVTIDTVCRGVSETLNVVVFKSPTATSIVGATEVCEDTSMVTYYIDGLSGSNFTWFVDGDTVANGIGVDTISLRWDTAGTYQLSVLEYTPDACSETLVDTITVYKTPRTSSISGDTVICFVAGDEFSYSVTGLDSSVYYWTLIGGTIISQNDTADSLSIRWDSVGVHSISITEVSKDSCVGLPVTLSITLNETPLTNVIEGNFYLCEQNLNILYKVSGIDSSTYYWDIQGGGSNQIADSNSLSVDWDSAGFYPIAVLEVSTKGCIGDTLDSLVQVNPLPMTSKISGDTGICFVIGDEFVYSVVGFSNSYFHWNIFGGTIMGVDSTDSLTIRWDSVGPGNITVVEESIDTCWGDTMSLKVDLWKVPYVDTIIGTTYLCEKNTELPYQLNGLDSSIYYWATTGGVNLIDDSTNSIKIDWDTLGKYEISALEVSVNNCKDDTIKLSIQVNPLPLTSSITGDTIICPSFEILHAYNVSGLDSSIYVWTITDAVISAGDSTDSITVKWDSITTNVQLSVFEISKDTCTNYSVTQNILLDAPLMNMSNVGTQESDDSKIDVDWIYIDNDVYPENVFVYRRVKFSNDNWELINTLSSTLEQYVDSAVLTSKNPYEYKVYGLNACGDTLKTVTHNSILLNGKKDEDKETISVNWNRYNGWEFGVDDYELWRKLDKETEYTFYRDMVLDTSVVLTDGYEGFIHCYRLKAKSGFNESWSNELCVEFDHLLSPPTAISPNGDEYNEQWTIHNIDLYPEARVMIFNRWGNEVYYSVGYDNDFDGTRGGQPLPDGTYYYVIDPNIGTKVYKGYITIIR